MTWAGKGKFSIKYVLIERKECGPSLRKAESGLEQEERKKKTPTFTVLRQRQCLKGSQSIMI